MTEVEPQHLRVAAYILGEELAHRRRNGHPIPAALLETHAALLSALSDHGHQTSTRTAQFKTTRQLAAEWGCTTRTVRRKAHAAGGHKIGGHWLLPEDT